MKEEEREGTSSSKQSGRFASLTIRQRASNVGGWWWSTMDNVLVVAAAFNKTDVTVKHLCLLGDYTLPNLLISPNNPSSLRRCSVLLER